ncbi:hypothetical protein VEE16_12010 [Escherichia coli]|nr:hypothetical protein VEE16_12010 [Escherichia coli]
MNPMPKSPLAPPRKERSKKKTEKTKDIFLLYLVKDIRVNNAPIMYTLDIP